MIYKDLFHLCTRLIFGQHPSCSGNITKAVYPTSKHASNKSYNWPFSYILRDYVVAFHLISFSMPLTVVFGKKDSHNYNIHK